MVDANIAHPWREIIPPHEAVEMFPPISWIKLQEFAGEIKKGWLTGSFIVLSADGKSVVDGCSRLDALTMNGQPIFDDAGELIIPHRRLGPDEDPFVVATGLNLHRRHLDAKSKRAAIARLAEHRPDLSNRAIAKETGSSARTVASVRSANVKSLHKTERVEASGRRARGRKPEATKAPERAVEYVPPPPPLPNIEPVEIVEPATEDAPPQCSCKSRDSGPFAFNFVAKNIDELAERLCDRLTAS